MELRVSTSPNCSIWHFFVFWGGLC